MNDSENLLTVPQVADRLALSQATVYRLIRTGDLPALRFATSVRVCPAALRTYIDTHTFAATTPAAYEPRPERIAEGLTAQIVGALMKAGTPLRGIVIAHRTGQKYNSRFRGVLAGLVADGIVRREGREGYALPGRLAA
jgi:excisionase family DNA binding protein